MVDKLRSYAPLGSSTAMNPTMVTTAAMPLSRLSLLETYLDKLIFSPVISLSNTPTYAANNPPPPLLSNIILRIDLANHDVDATKINLVDLAQTGVEYILYG